MAGEKFKQAYALVLLGLTIAWAVFCVWITYRALIQGSAVNIIAAAGADFLLGSLATWDGLVVQHYFRKAEPE